MFDPRENDIKDLGEDCIVLLSTHIVSDIEHIADEVIMMNEGQIIYHGTLDNIGDLESCYLGKFEE